MAGYIGDPASDIMEFAHSYKGMSLYSASSSRKFVTGKEVEDLISEWTLRCPKDGIHPLYEHNTVSGMQSRLRDLGSRQGISRNCVAISSLRGSRQVRLASSRV